MSAPASSYTPDAAIRAGSTSFALASQLFDAQTRQLVRQLYAWCRYCDDVTDGQTFGRRGDVVGNRVSPLTELRDLSRRALHGDGGDRPAFAGLAHVAAATALPSHLVEDHLDGFAMDVAGQRYESLDDTLRYCYHVAGVVGLMMAWVLGVREPSMLLRGCDLGIAFQLTNIARDVVDDALAGRIYLPGEWLRAAHVELDAGRPPDARTRRALVPVVERLLAQADGYYASAWYGLRALPLRSAWAIATARHVYADIGGEVRRRGDRAWDGRATTSRRRKLVRATQGLGEAAWAVGVGRRLAAPPRLGLWTPPVSRVLS